VRRIAKYKWQDYKTKEGILSKLKFKKSKDNLKIQYYMGTPFTANG
jgi:hypothetical protein